MDKKNKDTRRLMIFALTRQQLMAFIKCRHGLYLGKSLSEYSDKELREIAEILDEKIRKNKKRLGLKEPAVPYRSVKLM